MQKFIFTLKRKCLRWSGPLSWTKRNSGGCHLLLLQISIKADTGCLPAKKKNNQLLIISIVYGSRLWIQERGGTRGNLNVISPDRSFIAAEKFPDLFCALSPTATRPLKSKANVHWINSKVSFDIINTMIPSIGTWISVKSSTPTTLDVYIICFLFCYVSVYKSLSCTLVLETV